MKVINSIIELLDSAISENPATTVMSGNIIATGYSQRVDEYRRTISESKDWLATYQAELVSQTGIQNIKLKHTSASGYFIEILKSRVADIPDDFIQKQTLVNVQRYTTTILQNFGEKLFESEHNLSECEYNLFCEVREKVLEGFNDMKILAQQNASLDFIGSLAYLAYEGSYIRPELQNTYDLQIEGGRHPVIEKIEKDFISNDLSLDSSKYIHTITGPNMGGKSTFLRQNALLVLLAHIGSFVPAKRAVIPLTDKIFSRVGASDNLFLGQSTFMIEMQEVANILHNSTAHSFVIIDEVGRGTSTFDGMSIAWAILKHNHDSIKAKTLFATHYHELVDEASILGGVKNFSVAVGEKFSQIVFLRKIIPGAIKKSYGLHVAKLAGINESTLSIAREMLEKLELPISLQIAIPFTSEVGENAERECDDKKQNYHLIINMLEDINIDMLTPLEALTKLNEIKKELTSLNK